MPDQHRQPRLLIRYLRSQRAPLLLLAVLIFSSIGLQLLNPQVIRYFLDTAESGGSERLLILAAILFISFALAQQLIDLAANYVNLKVSWTATNRLRSDLFLHCLKLDMPFHKDRTPGEMIERIDGDVNQLGNYFSQFTIRILGNGLLIAGILFMLFREDVRVGLGLLVYTLLTLTVLGVIQRPATGRWEAVRQASAEQYGYTEERISGSEELRACGAEAHALFRLHHLMRDYMEKMRAAFVISSLTYSLTNLVFVIGYAAGLAMGVYLYLKGEVSIGSAYLVTYYITMLSDPLQGLRAQAQDLQYASASVRRVEELFSQKAKVQEPAEGSSLALPDSALGVEFEAISFAYEENQEVLKEVSFSLAPGRILGILGRTGSGKTTLTNLLFRLYNPSQGRIRLGGADLSRVRLSDLRRRVGLVTQDVQLFEASVRDNLTFFNPDVPATGIEQALQSLNIWEWLRSLPQGLETRLAAGKHGLSSGEAQLLAFARVFLKEPGLVILDEASSRLDPATEALMEQALDRLFRDRTGIIVAHRLKTVLRADDILILENGQVVEFGPRLELAKDPASRFSGLLKTGLEEALV
jgi:ATP-binding cassette, subfamily B, bacterial